MTTIEQLEANLRPFKIALVEAFGLDPEKTWGAMSITSTTATFHVIDVQPALHPTATVRGDREDAWVEFPAELWTDEQRQAVDAYIAQFPPRIKLAPVDVEQAREALRTIRASQQLMVIPTGSDFEWQPAAQPAPTWSDVVRVMRANGYKLKVDDAEGRCWKWWVDEGTGGIIAEIWRQTLGGRPTWDVRVNGYGWSTHLSNPEPADVLAAGMSLGLIEGPVCGVQVTGISGFPRNQQKHEPKAKEQA